MTSGKDNKDGRAGERERKRKAERESDNNSQPAPIEWEDDEIISAGPNSPQSSFSFPSTPPVPYSPSLHITAPAEAENLRLDLFLVSQFGGVSRSAIQRAITNGDLRVNGK